MNVIDNEGNCVLVIKNILAPVFCGYEPNLIHDIKIEIFRQPSGLKILTPQGLEVGQIKEVDGGESNMTFPIEMDVRIKVRDPKS